MRHMLMLVALSVVIAVLNSVNAAPLANSCSDHVEDIDSEKAVKPKKRILGKEPPAAQIAAVDRRIDDCSVLVVINPQLAGEPRWTAPTESPAAKKYHTFDD